VLDSAHERADHAATMDLALRRMCIDGITICKGRRLSLAELARCCHTRCGFRTHFSSLSVGRCAVRPLGCPLANTLEGQPTASIAALLYERSDLEVPEMQRNARPKAGAGCGEVPAAVGVPGAWVVAGESQTNPNAIPQGFAKLVSGAAKPVSPPCYFATN